MLEIAKVKVLDGFRLRLTLTSGNVIERDLSRYVKEAPGLLRRLSDRRLFDKARASGGTVEWPGQIDLCPESLIWGGPSRAGRPRLRGTLRRGGILR